MATMVFTNMAAAELAVSVTAVGTALTVKPGQAAFFPNPAGGQHGVVVVQEGSTWEVMHLLSKLGDVLTVLRAQEGTVAQNFNVNAVVEQRVTKGVLENLLQASDLASTNYFVPLDGSKYMWGSLGIATANPAIFLQATAGSQSRAIHGTLNGVTRWAVLPGEASAENGGNTGSHFAIYRYNDAGAYVDTAMSIMRDSGNVTFTGNVTAQQYGNPSMALYSRTSGHSWSWIIDHTNGNTGFYYNNDPRFAAYVSPGGHFTAAGNIGAAGGISGNPVTSGGIVDANGANGFRSNGYWNSGGTYGTWLVRGNPAWGADGDMGIQCVHLPNVTAGVRIYVKPYSYDFTENGRLRVPGPVNCIGLETNGHTWNWRLYQHAGFWQVKFLVDGDNLGGGDFGNLVFLSDGIAHKSIDQGTQHENIMDVWGVFHNIIYYQSDAKYKRNITPVVTSSLDVIKQLAVKAFDYVDGRRVNAGLIAQEVQAIDPTLVRVVGTADEPELALDLQNLIGRLIGAVQELEAKIT